MQKPLFPQAAPPALAERVAPFIVMDVMNQAAAIERRGGSVVHLEVGQPSAPTPGLDPVRDGARAGGRAHPEWLR